jgi:lipopolysaccharide export system permease protein
LGQNQEQVLKFKVRLHQRIATPFSTVCFTILGLGVAVGQKNYHRATAFGLCILLMFNYYLLISVLGALGLIGQISPWLCAWLPNLITAIGAIVLLRKNYAH